MATPDAEQLILADIQRRDYRRALERLARGYAAQLGRLCLAMVGNQAEAEELVQEILIAALGAMPQFAHRASLRTWLYSIARRTCGRALAKRNRRYRLLSRVDAGSPIDDPLQLALAAGERAQLLRALGELTAAQQEVLLLRYVSGLSFREVAEVCGIREDAARQRASSGLRLLRRRMDPQPVVSPAAACQELSR
jgi:RNA polymerase sigma-70 factor (ECF subfamily)